MSYEQFWDMDCTLVKAYRQAYEMKQEVRNYHLWLQGLYIYDALCAVAPYQKSFSKLKKPLDYPKQPYELNTQKDDKEKADTKQKNQQNKNLARMSAFAAAWNRKYEKQQEGKEVSKDA